MKKLLALALLILGSTAFAGQKLLSPVLESPIIIGGTTTANAPTATHANTAGALDSATQCDVGYYSRGITTAGSAVGCTAAAGGGTVTTVTGSSATSGVSVTVTNGTTTPNVAVDVALIASQVGAPSGSGTSTGINTGDFHPSATYTISPSGGDFTTIQAALNAHPDANTLFLVYPGTYANDTITFTANGQCVVGIGTSLQQLVTQSSANIANFGAFTNTRLKNLTLAITGATSAVADITGSTGTIEIIDVNKNLTNSSVASAVQPSLINLTASAVATMEGGEDTYTNSVSDGSGTTAVKAAYLIGTGASLDVTDSELTVTSSGQALGASIAFAPTTGIAHFHENHFDISDSGATYVIGFYQSGASIASELLNNIFKITGNAGGVTMGVLMQGTGTLDTYGNDFDVSGGGANYSFGIDPGNTVNSNFDKFTAANGHIGTGTFNIISSEGIGELTVTGNLNVYGTISGVVATLNNVGPATSNYSLSSHKLTNLLPGSAGTDAATVSQISAGIIWLSPIMHPYVIDDSLVTPPGTCVVETAYIAAATAGAWTAGHLYECLTAAPTWVDLGLVGTGSRFGINFSGLGTAAGSFVGKSNYTYQITGGTPGAYTYSNAAPVGGDQVFVDGVGGIDYRHIYWYSGTAWIDTQGGASSNPAAGYGLAYAGNTLLVDVATIVDKTSSQSLTNKIINGLIFAGTNGSTVQFGTGGTVQYTGGNYAIGAGTGQSLAVTGALDGRATLNLTTATSNAACSALTCYNYNNTATAGAAVGYTLGTAQAGMQQCFKNYTGKTGILTITTSAAGQFINLAGVLTASGGNITSAGALGDAICLVAVDATHWDGWVSGGTWTLH